MEVDPRVEPNGTVEGKQGPNFDPGALLCRRLGGLGDSPRVLCRSLLDEEDSSMEVSAVQGEVDAMLSVSAKLHT